MVAAEERLEELSKATIRDAEHAREAAATSRFKARDSKFEGEFLGGAEGLSSLRSFLTSFLKAQIFFFFQTLTPTNFSIKPKCRLLLPSQNPNADDSSRPSFARIPSLVLFIGNRLDVVTQLRPPLLIESQFLEELCFLGS
ncbi:hypothetical protein NM208_g16237 [Fusarium decemcellulare]|uniref:Uncharacterized protein n=1 Tax=Fusarium decemcellulare TaxID=57161 RepID=A0ACC1RDF4_9HYPO|nr:hypothetical protein NM208_g16237 [Fusarium decemcellulare]